MNDLTISLDTRSRILYEQIHDGIKTIPERRDSHGEKARRSTDSLSKHLEVSRSTVELAYERLPAMEDISSLFPGDFVAQIDEL